MAHEFAISKEIEIDATPEQVWEAISSGPGVDSWFMGRNEIEPGVGGTVRFSFFGDTSKSTVTAWEPGKRFAYQGDEAEDGTFMAFEYLIEGRAGGSTVVRFVHSGFLSDDWETEYDALQKGDAMYLHKLAQYVTHFYGRISRRNLFLPGPKVGDEKRAWAAFTAAFDVTGTVAEGDKARLTVPGLPAVDGVVDYVDAHTFLGVRTSDGIYRLIYGHDGTLVVEHHDYSTTADQQDIEPAWQKWLTGLAG
ncbi:SRPBCC family protein [Streptosporangium sp. KLBMP 9127]|nr:SRPBCC domain-containing protein [Streptosporangium sp. KLBMP 9127]